jgi:transposase-like protein
MIRIRSIDFEEFIHSEIFVSGKPANIMRCWWRLLNRRQRTPDAQRAYVQLFISKTETRLPSLVELRRVNQQVREYCNTDRQYADLAARVDIQGRELLEKKYHAHGHQ